MKKSEITLYVCQAQADNTYAFRILYDNYKNQIYQFIRFKVKNSEDTKDLVIQTFTKAFQKIKTLKTPEAFGSWLYKIAENEVKMYFRTQRLKSNPTVNTSKSFNPHPDIQSIRVKEALNKLTAIEQNLIYYRYFENRSVPEIAELTAKSPEQIKYLLSKARKKFRRYYLNSKIIPERFGGKNEEKD
ncbi:MAG: sigma-70 family RNA polymerase sigma factor [candidate division WOR-3 bacterium]|nr:sigma-70 family RNA polymerase sigma factor [candidate division WOR-3 bacterium]